MTIPKKIEYTSQEIDNLSFDEQYGVSSSAMLGEDGSVLRRVKVNSSGELVVSSTSSSGGGGIPANKATDAYAYQAKSNDGTYKYFFYEDGAGNWYIMRLVITTGVATYTKGTGGYTSVYVDSTSAPSGSPTWSTYDVVFNNVGASSLAFDVDGNLLVNNGHVDQINGTSVTMDWEHHAVHEGIAYDLNIYSTVTNGTPKYCQFKTGAGYIHLKQKVIVNGTDTLLCQFIEAPTVTDGTTTATVNNRNRNSANTTTMTVYTNPTAVSGGTILEYDYLSGTNQSAAAPAGSTLEWILKPNTSYVYKLENATAGTATFLSKLLWYEH